MKSILRIYLDTSVFGGFFDSKFEFSSRRLFSLIKKGHYKVIMSDVVNAELEEAPDKVRDLAISIGKFTELVGVSTGAIALQREYISAGIVTQKSLNDALHVAIATTCGVDAIVSWNFKHIVKLDKIARYNHVNMMHGYQKLTIISPEEISREE